MEPLLQAYRRTLCVCMDIVNPCAGSKSGECSTPCKKTPRRRGRKTSIGTHYTLPTPLLGIGLHDLLHGQRAYPEVNSFHQGFGQICPRSGLFSFHLLPKGGQIFDIPSACVRAGSKGEYKIKEKKWRKKQLIKKRQIQGEVNRQITLSFHY